MFAVFYFITLFHSNIIYDENDVLLGDVQKETFRFVRYLIRKVDLKQTVQNCVALNYFMLVSSRIARRLDERDARGTAAIRFIIQSAISDNHRL